MSIDCQYKRCTGQVEIQASGLDADGSPVQLGTCDRCGRVTETVPEFDHPSLFGGAA